MWDAVGRGRAIGKASDPYVIARYEGGNARARQT